jgi:multiple sugar transport system permease protein
MATAATVELPPGRLSRIWRFAREQPIAVALILIAPALALRAFTSLWPFIDTAWISLHRSGPLEPGEPFVGLRNYRELLSTLVVRDAIFFTFLFAVASTALELMLGVAIAALLNTRFRLRRIAQTMNLIPWAIPVVVTGIAFRFALDSETGLFSHWISAVTGTNVDWLLDPTATQWSVIATNVWRNAPFVAIVLVAAMQAIPDELYEAARVDGAAAIKQFRFITLPLIAPVLISMGIFFLIWQVATFDLVLSMTGGGPGSATQVLGYEAYLDGFQGLRFGTSAALSMLLFGFVAVFGILGFLALKLTERRL